MTVNSFKKPVSSTKMDVCVPSPDFSTFSTSPPSSIYDHDRSHDSTFCGSSIFSNITSDFGISDEMCGLDDNMEDGSLENYLTPDVMNSFSQITNVNPSQEFSWIGKLEHDVSMPAVSESPNPTLAQLDMEPDISFVNDMINVDQDDNKMNFSTLDFLCNDTNDFIIQPCFSTVSNSSPGSTMTFVPSCADFSRCSETASLLNDTSFDQKSSIDVGNNYITAGASFESNFPPRTSQPQLIGVAAVIKPELKSFTASIEENDDLRKMKAQSPNLHKLLSNTHPLSDIRADISKSTNALHDKEFAAMRHADICAQIVPSSSATKRTHTGIIKTEPMSPKPISKTVIKEETMEEKWRDVEHFIRSPGELSPKKSKRCDSWSSGHLSDDDDDDDSSLYGGKGGYYDSDDDYSDIDADLAHISPSECESLVATGKKQKQFFWQYNVQSKGPKGTRLKLSVESPSDPHVLNDFEDPVFDECNTAIAGIRHGGKARKGDGNEITPNPRKLFMIGHQLLRLNRQINACQLGNDVPAAKRNESRKEKNKLASRACRLKKKAQHEANKIKLYGLEQEHSQLNSVLQYIWPHIQEKTKAILGQTDKTTLSSTSATLKSTLESQIEDKLKSMIAGHTTDYVNSVIIKVESGDNSGGLNLRRNHKT